MQVTGSRHHLLRLSNEIIHKAVGFRLGIKTCEPHTCPRGEQVDARQLHGLSCRRSSDSKDIHRSTTSSAWRAIKQVQVPSSKEPLGLTTRENRRPDGVTLLPWSRENPRHSQTSLQTRIIDATYAHAGSAANNAANLKTAK